jgi:hypothetical protein
MTQPTRSTPRSFLTPGELLDLEWPDETGTPAWRQYVAAFICRGLDIEATRQTLGFLDDVLQYAQAGQPPGEEDDEDDDPCPMPRCVDCSADTYALREYYMVHDPLWEQAGMTPNGGELCVGCLERRLGRDLTPTDFTGVFLNVPLHGWHSARLNHRLGGELTRAQTKAYWQEKRRRTEEDERNAVAVARAHNAAT